jgi:hypothetical protein
MTGFCTKRCAKLSLEMTKKASKTGKAFETNGQKRRRVSIDENAGKLYNKG